jgi:hypothetical protein
MSPVVRLGVGSLSQKVSRGIEMLHFAISGLYGYRVSAEQRALLRHVRANLIDQREELLAVRFAPFIHFSLSFEVIEKVQARG